jgi:hypothetical protein
MIERILQDLNIMTIGKLVKYIALVNANVVINTKRAHIIKFR